MRKAYAKRIYVDRDFQAKTNALVQKHISTYDIEEPSETVIINEDTVVYIVQKKHGDATKVINLIKSIEKTAAENSDDPFLVAMAERAKLVQEQFESRQTGTAEALEELLAEVARNETRKKEQAERGFDELTCFVFNTLEKAGISEAESVSRHIKVAFTDFPNWRNSESALRELRNKVTFAIYAECDDLDEVTALVEDLFRILERSGR